MFKFILAAMLVLAFQVSIAGYRFAHVNEVNIESTWKRPGDVATITLPYTNGSLTRAASGRPGIKVGDPVEIQVGYNGKMSTEFTGFVSAIKPNMPLEIECEDMCYLLRKTNLQHPGVSTLAEALALITAAVPGVQLSPDIPSVTLGSMRVDCTAFNLLETLRREKSLVSYFRGRTLFVGLAMGAIPPITHQYVYGGDRSNVISTSLSPLSQADDKIKLKAIGKVAKADGKGFDTIEVELGDADGTLRTLSFFDVANAEELKQLAQAYLDKSWIEGYEGGFQTFGWPVARHGDAARFTDLLFPERSGEYYIDEVNTSAGLKGWKREVKIGQRLDLV